MCLRFLCGFTSLSLKIIMQNLYIFLLGFLLCGVLIGVFFAIRFYVFRAINQQIDLRFAEFRATQYEDRQRFFEMIKTHLPENDAKMVANSENTVHNSAQVQETEPPFWNNRNKIKDALERYKSGDKDVLDTLPLAGKTELEKWRELDSRLLELENLDEV